MKTGKEKKVRIYLEYNISKKQQEWVSWYERGVDSWWDAYYEYPARRMRKRHSKNLLTEKTWFNKVLRSLKEKGMFLIVPEAFISTGGICWKHPGFANDGYVAEALEKDMPDYILDYNKPII